MTRSLFNSDNPVMKFLRILCDLFILNILFVLTSLPIITIGASASALYSVTMKMARKEEISIMQNYFSAFKRNWKQGSLCWIILCITGGLLFFDLLLLNALVASPAIKLVLFVLLNMAIVIFFILELYLFPYVARFQNNLKGTLKNAMFIGISNFPYTICVVLLTITFLFFTFSSPRSLMTLLSLMVFFGFSVIAYIKSFFLVRVFKKYE